jgi:hypothetical protein
MVLLFVSQPTRKVMTEQDYCDDFLRAITQAHVDAEPGPVFTFIRKRRFRIRDRAPHNGVNRQMVVEYVRKKQITVLGFINENVSLSEALSRLDKGAPVMIFVPGIGSMPFTTANVKWVLRNCTLQQQGE